MPDSRKPQDIAPPQEIALPGAQFPAGTRVVVLTISDGCFQMCIRDRAQESARIVASAEQEIGMAAAQATRGLRNFAADLAIDQASRQLKLTPETDRALIAEFVGNVEKGGLN